MKAFTSEGRDGFSGIFRRSSARSMCFIAADMIPSLAEEARAASKQRTLGCTAANRLLQNLRKGLVKRRRRSSASIGDTYGVGLN